MDKNLNRPKKGRNKFNLNQPNPMSFTHGKRLNQIYPMINYENGNAFIPNQEYMGNQPYPENMYQIPMTMPIQMTNLQTKEQNIKNAFKKYLKKNNMPYNQAEQYNFGENEMSLEDNPQIPNKKFNYKSLKNSRIQRKRKNIQKSNKDLSINNNYIKSGQGNRAISTEGNFNYEEDIPQAYYNDNLNINNNISGQKGGRKKATSVEYNNRSNKYKKRFNRYTKAKKNIEEKNIINNNQYNPYNSDSSNSGQKNNNLKPYNYKSNNPSDIENDSNLNNYYSNEEEFEDEDKNSQIIEVVEDDKSITPKEVIDIKKIHLVEKPETSTDEKIIIKSNISEDKVPKKAPKNKIIPELEEMCSEKEIIEREKDKDIDRFEIDADAFPDKRPIKSRMVQKYKRKRGKILILNDPKEIRNVSAINKSINYLIEQILDCDTTNTIKVPDGFDISPMDIIQFITDRFTAIYKTIEILVDNVDNLLNNCSFIENMAKMIRTIIIFFNLCLDWYDDQSTKEINSLIDNLLLPLLEYFKDIIINESKYEYNFLDKEKDEFLSYYLFVKLKNDRKNLEKYYKEMKELLNNNQSLIKIELVNEIYKILKNKDYEKFMDIIKNDEKCDYLIGCFLSLFFKEINCDGLMKLSLKKKDLSYRQIFDNLIFEENEEIRDFLVWYGITKEKIRYSPNDFDIVIININNKNKILDYDKAPQKTNKRYIEKKKNDKLRKDIVSKKIGFIKNSKYNISQNEKNAKIFNIEEEKQIIKAQSLINSDLSKDKSNQNLESPFIKINNLKPSNSQKDLINNKANLNESFISKTSFRQLFPSTDNKINTKLNFFQENSNKSEKKITSSSKDKDNDEFLKPFTPKKISFEIEKKKQNIIISNDENKSLDLLSHPSISSIEGPSKYYSNFNEQTIEFFCDVASPIINKIIFDRKLNFIYRLKFIAEKYKMKLELIEDYINRRKFFVLHELKKCCLNKKFTKEYYKELINYNNNLNSENTNENIAFKIENKNLANNKNFELLTYEDIIYFLIKDFEILEEQKYNEENEEILLLNHLQINIYTTKDLIRSTKIISSLKLNKKLLKYNNDGSEFTIIDNNITINSNNKLCLIIKFIFVDQIIDLDSYIYDNQKNISKYSILIPFFDIMESNLENQQILTKFFTILDLGLGSFIKKDIIFFFIKRDIEQNSNLYKDYQNMQNDFIFNLMQKYSNKRNKNEIIYIDDDYENNEKVKEKIIYLSPIDEFGKCYQEYIKYLNNKAFVELFENNKSFHLNAFNPKEKLISFESHVNDLNFLINYYLNTTENDLKKYLTEINCLNYFYNNKLCIEILIGFIICKILLTYYQYICLSFANELFTIPFYISDNELLILEDNLLNSGSIFRQINLDGYSKLWRECLNLDINKKKNLFSYFDIFSEIICSYNLISDIDIQDYEFCFRKQYYDFNLEKKNYEISKNFVDFFNKIVKKFVSNNNLNIRKNNTSEIFKSIYEKNKITLLSNIAKILTNNSICFNESLLYINGVGELYHGLEKVEILEYQKNSQNLSNLNKKRKRNVLKIEKMKISNELNNNFKRKNYIQLNKKININKNNNENCGIKNNLIDINESIDKNNKSSISNNSGDINDEYYKCFRSIKKYIIPKFP